ncbi:MAG TPA: hypothetical protein EYQ50_27355 [Verrucomicrobiales bacterium]|nr:hypothetical protein [Verrucomicrobiales bacterium]HIL68384.1 hypothetical protein [Verrucomicrobiota bacterium]
MAMIQRMQQQQLNLQVTTVLGLEELLKEELEDLGIRDLQQAYGVVHLTGTWDSAAMILLKSRIGSRVMVSIAEFAARHQAMVYSQVRRIDWPKWFSPNQTFSVRVCGDFSKTDIPRTFAPLKIKDAICDEFRKRVGARPSVARHNPDVPIVAFFRKGRCEISLDLSGDPIHRRGYRVDTGTAPIREHRAAALLRYLGYDGQRPFVDPFCGAGTIAIEAAMIATGRPPGLLRNPDQYTVFNFSEPGRLAVENAWNEAEKQTYPKPAHKIEGRDIDPECIDQSRSNAERAGLSDLIELHVANAKEIEAPHSDIVCNPPYGERMEDTDQAIELLQDFTSRVKDKCPGSRLALVLPHGPMTRATGLKADRRLPVESAPLELRFMKFSIFHEKSIPITETSRRGTRKRFEKD